MRESRQGWVNSLGTWIGGLATVGLLIVGYFSYAHPLTSQGQQSFSVPVNAGGDSSESSRRGESSLEFQVKRCDIGAKLVSCSMTVVSPRYDRRLIIASWSSRLIDADGDTFQMTSGEVDLALERDLKLAFKLAFAVNKNVVRPLTVKMVGSIDHESLNKGFEIK